MIAEPVEDLRNRTQRLSDLIGRGELREGTSTIGGGSLPEETLPTVLLALQVRQPDRFLAQLRHSPPPVIARIEQDAVLIDLRTVLHGQDDLLASVLSNHFA
jgi:L-seryl-tRNA(Ser) seleniumtransferase